MRKCSPKQDREISVYSNEYWLISTCNDEFHIDASSNKGYAQLAHEASDWNIPSDTTMKIYQNEV